MEETPLFHFHSSHSLSSSPSHGTSSTIATGDEHPRSMGNKRSRLSIAREETTTAKKTRRGVPSVTLERCRGGEDYAHRREISRHQATLHRDDEVVGSLAKMDRSLLLAWKAKRKLPKSSNAFLVTVARIPLEDFGDVQAESRELDIHMAAAPAAVNFLPDRDALLICTRQGDFAAISSPFPSHSTSTVAVPRVMTEELYGEDFSSTTPTCGSFYDASRIGEIAMHLGMRDGSLTIKVWDRETLQLKHIRRIPSRNEDERPASSSTSAAGLTSRLWSRFVGGGEQGPESGSDGRRHGADVIKEERDAVMDVIQIAPAWILRLHADGRLCLLNAHLDLVAHEVNLELSEEAHDENSETAGVTTISTGRLTLLGDDDDEVGVTFSVIGRAPRELPIVVRIVSETNRLEVVSTARARRETTTRHRLPGYQPRGVCALSLANEHNATASGPPSKRLVVAHWNPSDRIGSLRVTRERAGESGDRHRVNQLDHDAFLLWDEVKNKSETGEDFDDHLRHLISRLLARNRFTPNQIVRGFARAFSGGRTTPFEEKTHFTTQSFGRVGGEALVCDLVERYGVRRPEECRRILTECETVWNEDREILDVCEGGFVLRGEGVSLLIPSLGEYVLSRSNAIFVEAFERFRKAGVDEVARRVCDNDEEDNDARRGGSVLPNSHWQILERISIALTERRVNPSPPPHGTNSEVMRAPENVHSAVKQQLDILRNSLSYFATNAAPPPRFAVAQAVRTHASSLAEMALALALFLVHAPREDTEYSNGLESRGLQAERRALVWESFRVCVHFTSFVAVLEHRYVVPASASVSPDPMAHFYVRLGLTPPPAPSVLFQQSNHPLETTYSSVGNFLVARSRDSLLLPNEMRNRHALLNLCFHLRAGSQFSALWMLVRRAKWFVPSSDASSFLPYGRLLEFECRLERNRATDLFLAAGTGIEACREVFNGEIEEVTEEDRIALAEVCARRGRWALALDCLQEGVALDRSVPREARRDKCYSVLRAWLHSLTHDDDEDYSSLELERFVSYAVEYFWAGGNDPGSLPRDEGVNAEEETQRMETLIREIASARSANRQLLLPLLASRLRLASKGLRSTIVRCFWDIGTGVEAASPETDVHRRREVSLPDFQLALSCLLGLGEQKEAAVLCWVEFLKRESSRERLDMLTLCETCMEGSRSTAMCVPSRDPATGLTQVAVVSRAEVRRALRLYESRVELGMPEVNEVEASQYLIRTLKFEKAGELRAAFGLSLEPVVEACARWSVVSSRSPASEEESETRCARLRRLIECHSSTTFSEDHQKNARNIPTRTHLALVASEAYLERCARDRLVLSPPLPHFLSDALKSSHPMGLVNVYLHNGFLLNAARVVLDTVSAPVDANSTSANSLTMTRVLGAIEACLGRKLVVLDVVDERPLRATYEGILAAVEGTRRRR